jgi:hypothetical protein
METSSAKLLSVLVLEYTMDIGVGNAMGGAPG